MLWIVEYVINGEELHSVFHDEDEAREEYLHHRSASDAAFLYTCVVTNTEGEYPAETKDINDQ